MVFVYNVLVNHHLAFNGAQYSMIKKIIQEYNEVDKFYMLPNITTATMTLEQRAALLANNLAQLADKEGFSG